jgi:protein TonB
MQANNILQADLLDIIFENKNKSYGAYALRKTYNKRLLTALGAMVLLCLFISLGSLFAGGRKQMMAPETTMVDLTPIDEPKPKEKEPEAEPAPRPATPPAQIEQVRMIQDVTPQIVRDELVNPDNAVKPVDELENARIGSINMDGADDPGNRAPTLPPGTGGNGKSLIGHGGNEVIDEGIFVTVQVEARFPGGMDAWKKYLERNLNSGAPVENGAPEGSKLTVVVSFIVDKDGNVSEVKAENDPGFGTAVEAVRIIRKSGKWNPAIQNGRNVIYRQRQSVTFLVDAG